MNSEKFSSDSQLTGQLSCKWAKFIISDCLRRSFISTSRQPGNWPDLLQLGQSAHSLCQLMTRLRLSFKDLTRAGEPDNGIKLRRVCRAGSSVNFRIVTAFRGRFSRLLSTLICLTDMSTRASSHSHTLIYLGVCDDDSGALVISLPLLSAIQLLLPLALRPAASVLCTIYAAGSVAISSLSSALL